MLAGLCLLWSTSFAAANVTAAWNAAGDVPIVAASYTAAGQTIGLTLSFAPVTGTTLTVINNTGLGLISGTFDNLAQGQTVPLTFGGITYHFVANYYGGTGNDLVLQWASNRLAAWGYNGNGQLGDNSTTQRSAPVAVSTSGILAGKTLLTQTSGSSHSLALCSDGTLAAWGSNNFGQLGNGTTTENHAPVAVTLTGALAGKTVVAISAGSGHNLALCSDGTVAAWGYNADGELGDGTYTHRSAPVAVNMTGALAGKSVVMIAAGGYASLALCADGTLVAWGYNGDGELGDGTNNGKNIPVAVNQTGVLAGKTVTAISAGINHSLVLCSDGTLASFGLNSNGQLGDGSVTSRNLPVAVNRAGVLSGKTAVAIASGSSHNLALCADGTLVAWGANASGQLGNSSTTQQTVPVLVTTSGVLSGKTIAALRGGAASSYAFCSDGTLAAWGGNNVGQLGDATTIQRTTPVAVTSGLFALGERYAAVGCGEIASHAFAVIARPSLPAAIVVEQPAGTSLASGSSTVAFSSDGADTKTFQIKNTGDGDLTIASVTIDGADFSVSVPPSLTTLVSGASTSFTVHYLTAGFNGAQRSGTLRIATNDSSMPAFEVPLTGTGTGGHVLSANYVTGAEIPLQVSSFTATGNSVNFTLGYAPPAGTTLMVVQNTSLDFIAGRFDNLAHGQRVAMKFNGVTYYFVANYYGGSGNDLVLQWANTRPVAWGRNDTAELGDGTGSDQHRPVPVGTFSVLAGRTIVSMAAGYQHTLALCSDGTVATWGNGQFGQTGLGVGAGYSAPTRVDTLGVLSGKRVIAIAAGQFHSLALCSDGTLASWGYNDAGRLGDGTQTSRGAPVAVNMTAFAGKSVVAIRAGGANNLALCSDGTAGMWGDNFYAQRGDGGFGSYYPAPVAIGSFPSPLNRFITALAPNTASHALCRDGSVVSWGDNGSGALGNNTTASRSLPVKVDVSAASALYQKTAVAVGDHLAFCSDGTLAAWGQNGSGQLGNNSTATSLIPVAVNRTGVLAGKTIASFASSQDHRLALCTDGTLAAWGANGNGQLGDNTVASRTTPVLVSQAALAAGESFSQVFSGTDANFSLALVAEPAPTPLALDTPMDGALSVTGQFVEYTFFARGGRAMTVEVDPNSGAAPVLLWAGVQLLDLNSNVLATGTSATSGGLVSLSRIVLPGDGTYRIRVNAPSGHATASGHYAVGVWDATPTVRTLNFGQSSAGRIASRLATDQWTFSARAGDSIQFHLVGTSSAGLAFKLTGPSNYVGFQDVTADQVLNLPSSGNYIVTAYSQDGNPGTYSFLLNPTTVTPLVSGAPYAGQWTASGEARMFSVAVSAAAPLRLALNDAGNNHNEIYCRFGAQPTRATYDYAATGAGAAKSLLVPSAAAGTWYLLIYGETISAAGAFSVTADSSPVLLTAVQAGVSLDANQNPENRLVLSGAGFNAGAQVTLVAADGTLYAPASSSFDASTQLTVSFGNGSIPAGTYTVKVTLSDGSTAQWPAVVINSSFGRPNLVTSIEVPNPIGRHIAATLYLNYANTGTAPMPAPLLVVSGTNPQGEKGALMTLDAALKSSGFWTSALPAGYSTSLQLLASGDTPGQLAPGESRRVPIYYAGWLTAQWNFNDPRLNFTVRAIQADDATPAGWTEASVRPPTIAPEAWSRMYPRLLGPTAGSYVRLLDGEATYLAQIGHNITDMRKLWSSAVRRTGVSSPLPSLGDSLDIAVANPGKVPLRLGRSFDPSLPGRYRLGIFGYGWHCSWEQSLSVAGDGTVTLTTPAGHTFVYQPDSRPGGAYFSPPGDNRVLRKAGSAYQFTSLDGSVMTYNPDGTVGSRQHSNGDTVTATYSNHRLATLASSAGASITFTYNAAGLVASLTDSFGRITSYTYDAASHLRTFTAVDGRVTRYDYDAVSPHGLSRITLADGSMREFTYDALDRISAAQANGGVGRGTFTYTGGRVTVAAPSGRQFSRYVDENGQTARLTDSLGRDGHIEYDQSRRSVRFITTTGAAETRTRNTFGQVTAVTDRAGNRTALAHDGPLHSTSRLTDPRGTVIQYTADDKGQRTGTTFPDGKFETVSRDAHGNPLVIRNAAGETIQYTYEAHGRVTNLHLSDGTDFGYTYDAPGHLLTATDPTGTATFTYEPGTGALSSVTYPGGLSLSFTRDAAGRRISMIDQLGYEVKYSYDVLGRLSALTDGTNALIVSYTYDGAGRLSRRTNGNGTYTTYEYDSGGRLQRLVNFAPGGAVNSEFAETYNADGFKATESGPEGQWSYTYDAGGALTHALFASNAPGTAPSQDLSYAYDAVGNRTSALINGAPSAYTANSLNAYTSAGGAAQTFDAKGNLLTDGVSTYTYNVLNQLASISGPAGTTTFTYDALGQLVRATSGGVITRYLQDPAGIGQLAATFDGSGNLNTRYVYGLGLTQQTSGGNPRYYDFDPLGSTIGTTNDAGTYVNRFGYLPFGESHFATSGAKPLFRYAGRFGVQAQTDSLLRMRKRMYSAPTGRFLTPDPLTSSLVRDYSYTANSPTGRVDPTGLQAEGAEEWDERDVAEGTPELHYMTDPEYKELLQTLEEGLEDNVDKARERLEELKERHDEEDRRAAAAKPLCVPSPTYDQPSAFSSDYYRVPCPVELPHAWKGPRVPYVEEPPAVGDSESGSSSSSAAAPEGDFAGPAGDDLDSAGSSSGSSSSTGVNAVDPNALYGPTGYGAQNFVTSLGAALGYRITYENDAAATAPAQSVTVSDFLNAGFDWKTFQLTGIGFGDNSLTPPAGSQHYQATVPMTWHGQSFNVEIEAGIHGDTGEVYASFQSLDPTSGLPPADVLAGFLPPENGTGRGQGYLNFSVAPKPTVPTGTIIPNVAYITFDAGVSIATNQLSETDPALGTDPAKEARVTLDANRPVATVTALPSYVRSTFHVGWSGFDGLDGSGIAGYTVYVSTDSGLTYAPWLSNTQQTSGTYVGAEGGRYLFYVVATSNVGNVQTASTETAAIPTQALSGLNYWRWQNFSVPANTGTAADTATPDRDGIQNLLKYALVIPPGASGVALLPAAALTNYPEGPRLRLILLRDSLRDGTTIEVQAADDPAGTWSAIATSLNGAAYSGAGVVGETDLGGGLMSVEIRDVADPASHPRRFLRVHVTH